MPGILPDGTSGGQVIRDGTLCTPQPGVINAYCPPAGYAATCDLTALPSSCDARITPAQINAIVSEMLSLAVCWDPNGPWNCASVTNLCAHFNAWWAANKPRGDGVTITVNDPYAIIPTGVVFAICADVTARAMLIDCILSDEPDNMLITSPVDGGLYVPPAATPPAGIIECDDTVVVAKADGTDPRRAPILPEPARLYVRQNTINLPLAQLKTLITGFGTANGYLTPLNTLILTNPDTCRPMYINLRYTATPIYGYGGGAAFTVYGHMLLDRGDGILVDFGGRNTRRLGGIPAGSLVQADISNGLVNQLTAGGLAIAPGASITIRWQNRYHVVDVGHYNAMMANEQDVTLFDGGSVIATGSAN